MIDLVLLFLYHKLLLSSQDAFLNKQKPIKYYDIIMPLSSLFSCFGSLFLCLM
jgi:hypothetical protein